MDSTWATSAEPVLHHPNLIATMRLLSL